MQDGDQVREFKKELEYLENLLNSRFNFYLVFASLFLVAVLGEESNVSEGQRVVLLFSGAVVSLLISLAVLRTTILVNRVLDWLAKNAPNNPLSMISKKRIWIPFRANQFLAGVSVLITILFFALAFLQWK